jgi:putative ABC transport system permease protein
MGALLEDFRHAARALRRSRGFTVTAIAMLAVGIGGASLMLSLVDQILVRPLPYPDSDRLLRIWEEHPGAALVQPEPPLSNRTLYAWRDRSRTLEGLAAYGSREYTVDLGGAATRVKGAEVSATLFSLLRVTPAVGRFFRPGEDIPTNRRFVVLSDNFWRERFGANPGAVGSLLMIDGVEHRVLGVARAGFAFPDRDAQLWTPFDDPTLTAPSVQGGVWLVYGLGRLKPGASLAQVEAEGTTVARGLQKLHVDDLLFGAGGPVRVRAERLVDQMTAGVRPALLALAVGVGVVLLIACANVATLVLARGVAQRRELAVRSALGATSRRLAQHLLAESLLLTIASGATGLLLAAVLLRLAPAVAPSRLPRIEQLHADWRLIALALLASGFTLVLCGVAPAWRAARQTSGESLHGAGDGATAGGFRGVPAARMRDGLLAAQAALAALLIVGTTLLGRSFSRLVHVESGYDVNVLSAHVYMPPGAGSSPRSGQFVSAILDRLRSDPRVIAAGAGNMMPFDDTTWITGFTLPEDVGKGKPTRVRAINYQVTPGYADALGLRLHAGRWPGARDRTPGRRLILVNEEFVRQYVAGEPVVGRQFRGGPGKSAPDGIVEIVGVVADVLKDGNDQPPQPALYSVEPADAPPGDQVDIGIRAIGDPAALAPALRTAVRGASPQIALGEVMPLSDRLSAAVEGRRLATAALGVFAGLAIVLASVGLLGALSYAVSQRRRELGVRAAVGATRSNLIALLVREGLLRTVVGLTLGLGVAAEAAPLLQRFLFRVPPLDLLSFAAAPAILLPLAAIACLRPALRAAAIDPCVVLRSE